MERRVYTIGYEGAELDRFLATLQDAGVATLADVRAVAMSRKRGFSKTALGTALHQRGIAYRHYKQLGTPKEGRQAARAGDAVLMRRIYCAEILETEPAQAALRELEDLSAGEPVCLLCFERDPALCHRRLLAQRLADRGWSVVDLAVV